MILVHYPKCTTCKKAAKWLTDNGFKFDERDIILERPNEIELKKWHGISGLELARFFNTSGIKYRELNLKDVVKSADQSKLFELLSSDGKLVKRPILVAGDRVLVGFNEVKWSEALK